MALKMSQEFPPLAIIHLAKYNIMNKQTNKQKPKTETVYNVLLPKSDGVGWRVEGGGGAGRHFCHKSVFTTTTSSCRFPHK